LERLDQAKVDGFPVLDGNNYIGVITRFCIYESYFYTNMPKELFLKTKKAKDVAIRHETVLQENEVFERTLIRFQYLPLLAVMDENKNFLGSLLALMSWKSFKVCSAHAVLVLESHLLPWKWKGALPG